MILEALNFAASFPLTSADHRPFIRSSVNLWARANRCAAAWADHERRTKAAILLATQACRQRRTVVVLGSGLVRDVPVAELSALFDTVVLVDLVHLASVRSWLAIKGLKNIRLIERDLSGLDALRQGEACEPLAFLRQVPYLDLVVSANLLSQIGIGAARQLTGDATSDTLVRQVIAAHVEGLAQVSAETCLVTDTGYTVIDRTGVRLETVDLMHGVDPGPARDSWDWPVVPFGEESPDYQIMHHVMAR
ncbi:MAG: hypothetical protein QE484_10395 [Rhizobium sp.]|nr:hypothetical protein [Rhizobium sp.]